MRGQVYIDGAIVELAEGRLPVTDRGFLYGDSVYEALRTFGGRPFALEDHLDRLERSAAGLALPLPPREVIREATRATITALLAGGDPDGYVRIVVTRGSGPLGIDPGLAEGPRLIVFALPLRLPPTELYERGARVVIVGRRRGLFGGPGAVEPQVKSGNYLNAVLAVAEAKRRGADEAIFCDALGRVVEGSTSNLFIVKGRRLLTPPPSLGLLEGITRRYLIACARSLGHPVDEVALWPVDLEHADEIFLTSSVRGLLAVVEVDGQRIGGGRPGPLGRHLAERYLAEATRLAAAD